MARSARDSEARTSQPRGRRPSGRSGGGAPPPSGERSPADAVTEFLTAFAGAVQKRAMYPPGHPALESATEELREILGELLSKRGRLSVKVRRDHLVVDDAATDPDSPALHGLASRLHAHQILVVGFREGVEADDLSDFLGALSKDPEREVEPLGLAVQENRHSWPNISLEPRRYDALQIGEREEGTEAGEMWLERARQEFDTEIAGVDIFESEPDVAARSIQIKLGEGQMERMVAAELFRLTRRLSEASGRQAEAARRRLSEVVLGLDDETLTRLLRLGQEGGRGHAFLRAAADSMDVQAVVRLIRRASDAREDRKDFSSTLFRLLAKLAASEGASADGTRGGPLRELVHDIVEDWESEEPSPGAYESFLSNVAAGAPAGGMNAGSDEGPVEPARLVKVALALEEPGGALGEAAERMIETGRHEELLDQLEEFPGDNPAADVVWRKLGSRRVLRDLLQSDPPRTEPLERIVDRAGPEVADVLLDFLSKSGSRSVRRHLYNLLVRIGAPVAPLLPRRLEDEHWFVRRNMLALLAELPVWPEGFSALPHQEDPDPRVRAEALKVAILSPDERGPALARALRDEDERVLTLALAAADASCPERAEPLVARHVTDGALPETLRVAAVRALSAADSREAREALLEVTRVRRFFFWKRLAPPTPVTLEALAVLADRWPDHPDAREVLREAARSDDPEIRAAVGLEEAA